MEANTEMFIAKVISKLPEDLRANYKRTARKSSSVIEQLRVAAVLKLWEARGYRDIKFDVPMTLAAGKHFSLKFWHEIQKALWLGLNALRLSGWGGCVCGLHSCAVVCPLTVGLLLFSPQMLASGSKRWPSLLTRYG